MIVDSLRYLLGTSARLVKRNLDLQLKCYNITTSQWALLKILSEHDSLTQAEIGNKLSSDKATVGSIIDKLIDRQLISKNLSQNDRRVYNVKISKSGLEIIKEAAKLDNDCSIKATKGLSEDEIEVLFKCLNKIITNLQDG